VVSNSAGSVTSNAATLTVNAAATAPTITTQPANQTVTAGQTATFTVAATGTAPLSYAWARNGTAISGATSASYTTPATTSSDNGAQFTVKVSNVAGNVTSNPATLTVTSGGGGGTMPQFGHVFIVMGENTAYSSSYNSSNMPYLTSLANQYGLATKYWADTHPSIGNDLNMASGVIPTNDDGQTPSSMPLSIDNIAHEVEQAGKTWKDYVETWNGCSAVNSGSYIVRHDPLQYFTNINKANLVCFSEFATDLANHTLPNLSWLAPNGNDDGHDSSEKTFDSWLKTVITPLLASSYFQPGGDGLLIVTFDEDDKGGTPSCTTTTVGQGCGGQVETVVISARSKPGYKSTAGDPANYNNTYDEANILRTLAEALGLNTSGLGAASKRLPMADFFQ
jgi:acid phosphatase